MNIATQLLRNDLFIENIKSEIRSIVGKRSPKAWDGRDGFIEGGVESYDFTTDFKFDEPEGDGTEWRIPFKVEGECTIGYITSDGIDGQCTTEGPCEGFIDIELPESTSSLNSIDEVVSKTRLNVTLDSVSLDAKGDEPDYDVEG
jgi:hypothetical protein